MFNKSNVILKKFRIYCCCSWFVAAAVRNVWPPQLNENLVHPHKEMNLFDIFAIKTCRRTGNEIVGYLPQELHKQQSIYNTEGYRRSPLYQGGLDIHCKNSEKGHVLINA